MSAKAFEDFANAAKKAENNEDKTSKTRQRTAILKQVQLQLALDKKALQIVERLLDNPVTEEFLLDCAHSIDPQHYHDAVIERSIIKQCGYPLCPQPLINVPRQQYHISTTMNKVYDITDRKCFCSSFCNKASKFYEAQLSDSPLWTREMTEQPEITLLTKEMERDAANNLFGVDVLASERIKPDEIDATRNDVDQPLREEALGFLADDLSNLCLPETAREREERFHNRVVTHPERSDAEQQAGKDLRNKEQIEVVSGKETDKQDPASRDKPQSSSILTECSGGTPRRNDGRTRKANKRPMVDLSSLDVVSRAVMEWTTDKTVNFIFGQSSDNEKSPAPRQVDCCETATCLTPGVASEALVAGNSLPPPTKPLPGMHKLQEETEEFALRVKEFYGGRHSEVKPGKKAAKSEHGNQHETTERSIRLPLVDSKSQMAIRRKIVSDRLNRVFCEILPTLGLSLRDITSYLNALIGTFCLSSSNITFKPAGWMILGFLLLLIISKRESSVREVLGGKCLFLDTILNKMGTSVDQLASVIADIERAGRAQSQPTSTTALIP